MATAGRPSRCPRRQEIAERNPTSSTVSDTPIISSAYEKAIDYFQQAIRINQEIGDRHSQAVKLNHLADAYHTVGDHGAARHAWHQALSILDQLGVIRAGTGPGFADADAINAKLHRLDTPDRGSDLD